MLARIAPPNLAKFGMIQVNAGQNWALEIAPKMLLGTLRKLFPTSLPRPVQRRESGEQCSSNLIATPGARYRSILFSTFVFSRAREAVCFPASLPLDQLHNLKHLGNGRIGASPKDSYTGTSGRRRFRLLRTDVSLQISLWIFPDMQEQVSQRRGFCTKVTTSFMARIQFLGFLRLRIRHTDTMCSTRGACQ